MKGPERPCSIKPQQTSSRNVLQRSVEPAAQSGHWLTSTDGGGFDVVKKTKDLNVPWRLARISHASYVGADDRLGRGRKIGIARLVIGLLPATAYFTDAARRAGLKVVLNMSQISARDDSQT